MLSSNSKRVVVIKNIPSNIIEEAILILKPESAIKNRANSKNIADKSQKNGDDFLIKEAEVIINSYIKENSSPTGDSKKHGFKQNTGRKKLLPLSMTINLVLIGSILLLIFMISKLF